MRRRQITYVVSFVALTVVLFAATLIAGNKPILGLDLQGGVSVVLAPREAVESDTIDQAIEIIRNRVDALGVAEPEITRQGDNILVQIPGVEDQQRALELVGTTAELRFRPVLRELPPEGTTLEDLGIDPNATTTTAPTTTDPNASTTVPETTTTLSEAERREQLEELYGLNVPTTPPDQDTADATVVLPEIDPETGEVTSRFELGPAPLKDPNDPDGPRITGTAVDSANAEFPAGEWIVAVDLKDGDQGADQINELATQCRAGDVTVCPGGKLGITLDGEVQFAGVISSQETPPFPDGKLTIQGGYSKDEAKDIALALRYGSLPVELEARSTQTVSATLGNDAKNAGIIAGIVGLGLVAVYVLLYYRLLGAVALVSLVLSAMLLWVVIAYLGETRGLALTLAGITGLIVSIGVSLDSNIVYFEHMKEDINNGRTPRSASERSFKGALSTVIKADVASLIGAATLYFLTVGAVRGFAFYLGLAMILDLAATYFFLGPAVQLLARRPAFSAHPGRYGLPSGPINAVATPPPSATGATPGVVG